MRTRARGSLVVAAAVVLLASSTLACASPSLARPKPLPAGSCGGVDIVKSTGGYWTGRFDDEFSGLSVANGCAVEWIPSMITISYDGSTCLVENWTPASPLVEPQPFLIALTQGLAIGSNACEPASTPLSATTQVDYVRVWK